MNKDNPLFRMMQKHTKANTQSIPKPPIAVNPPKTPTPTVLMSTEIDGPEVTVQIGEPMTGKEFAKVIEEIATPKPVEKNTSDSVGKGLTNVSTSASLGAGISEKASTELKVPNQMLLSPMAQKLMQATALAVQTAPAVAEDSGASPEYKPLTADGGIHELAAMNTDSLEPQMHVEKTINVKAEALTKAGVLNSGESVRELCDKIDAMIAADQMVAGPSLATLRNYVMTLMMTLKSKPEYDSVIIDKDIRNVMTFIRSTRQESLDLREIKTTKKAVRAAKKEGLSSVKQLKGMEAAFNKMMGLGPK
jgi:hypothetical protein